MQVDVTNRAPAGCADRTMRVYDAGAVILITLAGLLAVVQPSATGHGGRGAFAVASSLLVGVTMIGSLAVRSARRRPEGDEYLRKLMGVAAGIGFYATFTIFMIWMPLAPGTLPAPSGDRIIAVLLATTGLGWLGARVRQGW